MKRSIVLLLIAFIFILYQSWFLLQTPYSYNGDQKSVYLLAMRQTDPTFLSRDYAYGDPNFLKFYTPVYLAALQFLMRGLGDYDTAVFVFHSLMMTLYLATMFILLRYVSGNVWVALFVTLISSLSRPAIASEVWGSVGLNLVMPRTAFLAIAPLLFWLTFRWLSKPEWWRIPLLGFLGGVSANLHPPSGMFFTQILITLALVFTFISLKEMVWKVLLTGLAAIVGALPTLASMIQNVAQPTNQASSISFEKYAAIIHERSVSIFPFPSRHVTLPHGPLTDEWQIILAIVGGALMLGWLGIAVWWRIQSNNSYRRFLIGGLLIIILPLAYLATIFSALDVIIVTAGYWWVRLVRQDEDQLDLYVLGVLACAAVYSFVGSAALGWIWQTFEVWPLTSLYSEQARISRFVYLPLFIFTARWLVLLVQQSRDRALGVVVAAGFGAGLIVRHWHFLDPWKTAEWGMCVSLIILAIVGIIACIDLKLSAWSISLLFALGVTATMYLWLYIVGFPQGFLVAVLFGLIGGLGYYTQTLSLQHWQFAAAAVVIMSLVWLFSQGKVAVDNDTPLRVQAHKTLGLYQYSSPSQNDLDASAMYDWIRANTSKQALFYFDDKKLDLRFRAHRAATHGWKDLSAGYYSPPTLLQYFDRYTRLETAYQSPETLLACAVQYQADYIIANLDQLDLPLPLAYSNGNYYIYALNIPETVQQLSCP